MNDLKTISIWKILQKILPTSCWMKKELATLVNTGKKEHGFQKELVLKHIVVTGYLERLCTQSKNKRKNSRTGKAVNTYNINIWSLPSKK